jgi:LPS sulfotransferase NodH
MISEFRDKADALYVNSFQRTYYRMFGHTVERRFAIVGNARTGSNFLLDGLKTSPSIRMYHEIFADHNRQIGKDFDRVFATVFQPESQSTEMVGFKVFYNHLTDEEWQRLLAHKELKIIHLTRRNRLRTVISLEIAFKTGQWTQSGKKVSSEIKERRLQLEPSRLIQRLEQIEAGEAAARVRFRDREILEVVYEDLVSSPLESFEAVGRFLGVRGIDPKQIRLRRQNPEPLQQLLVNYDEVEAALLNTRFAGYLQG